uniref:Photosystem II protein N n=1 Tax=Berchemiella wilsonii TaxID=325278 RepID=A0A4Y5WYC3_9ROSA|nr:photosystem II protein N [Berchemiella wilsonii]QDE13029.1 photosystem II protein N [Berchemiella wilsonii]
MDPSYHRSIVVLKLYNNGNSNPSCTLYIWFTCKFYWVRLIYCFWATLSTTKRSIRGTRRLVEVLSLPILGGSVLSIEIMKNHFTFLVGTLGGSRKKIAKKMIPKVETKRNV